jgi:hypothetical protein
MHALVGEGDKIVINDDDIASIRREKVHDHESVWTTIKKVLSSKCVTLIKGHRIWQTKISRRRRGSE